MSNVFDKVEEVVGNWTKEHDETLMKATEFAVDVGLSRLFGGIPIEIVYLGRNAFTRVMDKALELVGLQVEEQ